MSLCNLKINVNTFLHCCDDRCWTALLLIRFLSLISELEQKLSSEWNYWQCKWKIAVMKHSIQKSTNMGTLTFQYIWNKCGSCGTLAHANVSLPPSLRPKQWIGGNLREPPAAFQPDLIFTRIISNACLWVWPEVTTESGTLEQPSASRTGCLC